MVSKDKSNSNTRGAMSSIKVKLKVFDDCQLIHFTSLQNVFVVGNFRHRQLDTPD